MGHFYLGRQRTGWALLGAMVVFFYLSLVTWVHGGASSPLTLGVWTLCGGLWLGQILWAVRLAGRSAAVDFETKPIWKRPPAFYIAAWVVTVIVGRVLLKPFIIEGFVVPQDGMAPSLLTGDHIFVAKLGTDFRNPKRGDVIVFREPERGTLLVQRVVAVGGELISVRNGLVSVNGSSFPQAPCREPEFRYSRYQPDTSMVVHETAPCFVESPHGAPAYSILADDQQTNGDHPESRVPQGYIFVLGDSRNSYDSRSFGPVPTENIIGKAKRIWWSKGHAPDAKLRWSRVGTEL